ncbi:hypothetical protein LNP00_03545 [Fructobacillus sp. M158]|uniref:hypothetical protein n=1 Tax=Fructobacillus parabroussonetiae TaxID=2713174 RepID=UPI00200A8213|nr:hypothetical protein [Fructobacillus parabroussonetiae]MCK8617441.1 hypothetical protein [Fructobacillus parabroussonetiae]
MLSYSNNDYSQLPAAKDLLNQYLSAPNGFTGKISDEDLTQASQNVKTLWQ